MHRHIYPSTNSRRPHGAGSSAVQSPTVADAVEETDVVNGPITFSWDDDEADEDDMPDIDGDEDEEENDVDELNFDDIDYGRLNDDDDEDDWDEEEEEDNEEADGDAGKAPADKSEDEAAKPARPDWEADVVSPDEDAEDEDEARLIRMFSEAAEGAEADDDETTPSDSDLSAIDSDDDW